MPHPAEGVRAPVHRVAMFLTDLTGGGAERSMLNLAVGLAAHGVKVDLVLASAVGAYLDEVPPDVRLVDLAAGRTMRAIPGLVRYLKRTRPDVLVSTLHHACLAAALAHVVARSSARLFLREANSLDALHRGSTDLRKRTMVRAVRWAYGRADGVIAVSEGVAADLRSVFGVPPEKVWTLNNPVVRDDIDDLAAQIPEHAWLTDDGPPVVLGVGRLVEQKGFDTLVEAFALLRKRRSARLVILGEGGDRDAIEARVRLHGLGADVSLPGFVANPFAYYARAGVFVLASRFEGLPGALIQALACGCPIVATDCRSGPAEILENGSYGELVPVGDAERMAQAIERAPDGPRCTERQKKRASRYALGPVVRSYLEAFEGPGDARGALGSSRRPTARLR